MQTDAQDIERLIEAATAALTWMEANQLPKPGDAWGCSVLRRLRDALYAKDTKETAQ